ASEGKAINPADWELPSALIQLGACIVCAILGFGIAWAKSRPFAPPSEDKELPTVLPVDNMSRGISRAPLPTPPLAQRPVRSARATGVRRTQPVPSTGSTAVWWVVGALAIGLFVCVIPVGGLIVWRLWSVSSPPPQPVVVVKGDPQPFDGNNFQFKDKEWGQEVPKMPKGMEVPPGGPAGGPQFPQQMEKP